MPQDCKLLICELIPELAKMGLKPAGIEHALALRAQNLDFSPHELGIVFAGSTQKNMMENTTEYPWLSYDWGQIKLNMGKWVGTSTSDSRSLFAAISNNEDLSSQSIDH